MEPDLMEMQWKCSVVNSATNNDRILKIWDLTKFNTSNSEQYK